MSSAITGCARLPLWLGLAFAPAAALAGVPAPVSYEVDTGPPVTALDPQRSKVGFSVRTRWFARLNGEFQDFNGSFSDEADGARRARVEVEVASVDFGGRPRMNRWALSEEFFDAARHPRIVYRSDPFAPSIARDGGRVDGELSLRGVQRRVSFAMAASACERPGLDCPIVLHGSVSRHAFGMHAHPVAVHDRVELRFEVQLAEPEAP